MGLVKSRDMTLTKQQLRVLALCIKRINIDRGVVVYVPVFSKHLLEFITMFVILLPEIFVNT